MAEFIVTFDRGTLPPPEYDDYSKQEVVPCGTDVIARTITFDGLGDFRLGVNFTSNYNSAKNIRVEDYSDIVTNAATSGGTPIVDNSFIPSELTYNGTVVTLPFTFLVSNINLLNITNTDEMLCRGPGKFDFTRTRKISYFISDTNNQYGPQRESTLINLGAL